VDYSIACNIKTIKRTGKVEDICIYLIVPQPQLFDLVLFVYTRELFVPPSRIAEIPKGLVELDLHSHKFLVS